VLVSDLPAVLAPLAGRGVGVTDLLHGQAPWALIVLFALFTQLGDVWFLFLFSSVLYVGGDTVPYFGIERHRGVFLVALVITYVALIGLLKEIFLLPRPPDAHLPPALGQIPAALIGLFTSVTTADGPGFPSGHALGTTMVWGGLALVLNRGTFRSRVGVAAAVVALVSLARLVIGVHYLVDVLVGATLGIVVLGGLYWLSDRGAAPGRVLIAAVAIAGLGITQHLSFDSVAAVGGAVGGWIVWEGVAEPTLAHPSTGAEVGAAFLLSLLGGGLFGAVYAVEPSYPVTFFMTVAAAGAVVGAPFLGERLA
jgi:membrane-associated phospholipid phosphatase